MLLAKDVAPPVRPGLDRAALLLGARVILFFFLIFYYSWFIIFLQFLLYNSDPATHTYIHSFFFFFFHFPTGSNPRDWPWFPIRVALDPSLGLISHIFGASGRRPGYPPAFLVLYTYDLIQPHSHPRGRRLCPTLRMKRWRLSGVSALTWAQAGALAGPRLQWAGGMSSWRPHHTIKSGFKSPIDPMLSLNKPWPTGQLTLSRAAQGRLGVCQAQLPSFCRLGDLERAS